MFMKQLSVFIENRSGRLAAACDALAEKGINILALSLADTADFGILRMIVTDPEVGYETFRQKGFTVITNDVLENSGINVEYMYAFSAIKTGRAALVFRFEDNAAAVEALKDTDVNVMNRVDVLGE